MNIRQWSWRNFIRRTSPSMLMIYTFGLLILCGTSLLSLPIFHAIGKDVSVIDSAFTVTSAACVTGLLTVSSFTESFNFWGQLLVLIIIQLGGLGVIAFAAIAFRMLGFRFSMRGQAALEDSFYQRDAAYDFSHTFYYVFYLTFALEAIGAIILTLFHLRTMPFTDALWFGIFHAISAFCNAGISLCNSSMNHEDGYTLFVIMVLVILGGLGHIVLAELARLVKRVLSRKPNMNAHLFSYHTKVVLTFTALLLTVGTIVLWLTELDNNGITWFDSLFQAITARTAGFSTVAQTSLTLPATIVMIFLMFIGGGPGSCAGGIKVTSLGVWFANVRYWLTKQPHPILFNRGISAEVQSKVGQLLNFAIIWNAFGVFVLVLVEPDERFIDLVFEQISAFATVGLSRDFTGTLTLGGKIWIMLSMFVGRLGPLTIALSLRGDRNSGINYPEGRMMIG